LQLVAAINLSPKPARWAGEGATSYGKTSLPRRASDDATTLLARWAGEKPKIEKDAS